MPCLTLKRLLTVYSFTYYTHFANALFSFKTSVRFCSTQRRCNFVYSLKQSTALPLPVFRKLTSAEQIYIRITYTEFYPNWTIDVERTDRNSLTPLSKKRFSRSVVSQKQKYILYTECYSNVSKNGENKAKFHSRFQVKCGFHWTDFLETQSFLLLLLEDVQYRMSPESVKKYGKCRSKCIYLYAQ